MSDDVNTEQGEVTLVRVNGARVDVRGIVAADPDRVDRDRDRDELHHHIRAYWYTGDVDKAGYRPLASLLVRHQPGTGYLAFLERLRERVLDDSRVEQSTTSGDRLYRLLAIPGRPFSAEGLDAAYDAAVHTLRFVVRGGNRDVLRYFTPTGGPAPSGRYRG